ncbi:Mitochondrial ribosome small subunit bioproteinsis protein [Sporothrix epigloea]|uniref:Mitochondrial ribosome small subunit bioproteinsis protein n=1 Tax=Sporothrix epigloea TaxID=1892477 RepID=A0ABP0DI69_9PEZI
MAYLGMLPERKPRIRQEDRVIQEAIRRLELEHGGEDVHLRSLLREPEKTAEVAAALAQPQDTNLKILCGRCHDLVHHGAGNPIYHPDIDSIRETVAESPYKYNHVYHILDAADFPMSLLPRINTLLDTMPLRSRNRRSRHAKFYDGRLTELSFVITRSDLLAPRRDQVDKLMPWIRENLRDALGRAGRDVRLGNVRCVSARRNWWTPELKEEIWKRGGANWLVGKANVGKSYLVHHVFPKGRMEPLDKKKELPVLRLTGSGSYSSYPEHAQQGEVYSAALDEEIAADLNVGMLLPPRPDEINYPQMPVVSGLPGTTASPIRIPFGSGKGELIDLPGLERSALVDYVKEAHKGSLVMKSRIEPEQVVLKGTDQSLLLGGFIRITPRTPGLVFMTYNFTPLQEHRTMTEKAIAIQEQTSVLRVENIAVEGTGEKIALAGSFRLQHDVTKIRAGPITRKDAANISVDRLPYRVVALDLLIEGCGWVEIVAQVRTRDLFNETRSRTRMKASALPKEQSTSSSGLLQSLDLSEPQEPQDDSIESGRLEWNGEAQWPVIDVYSPMGKFIGSRRPLNAWMTIQPKISQKKKSMRARPKKSVKGVKKQQKADRRTAI